jgi:DNA repair protein RadD
MNLRDYQQKVIEQYRDKLLAGISRICLTAPTGSGKTVIFCEIVRQGVGESKRALIIEHRNELLTQARDKLKSFGISAGIIKAGRDKDQRPQALVQIASVQTLHARVFRSKTMELPPAEIVIIDECHHVRARTYQSIVEAYPNAIILGLTATPCRGDGRGLGNVFDAMIECPQIGALIELGYLVKPKIFAPEALANVARGVQVASTGDYQINQLSARMDTDALVGDVVEHWLRHAQRRRTIMFAVDIAHSVHIVRELVKSGVKAEHLDGNTDQAERDAILARLASGETEVVCNVGVLTEGFDLCDIGCIALVRPTRSLGLFRQMIGRGLRPAPGKSDIIILDHSGGVHRHGRPDDPIEWTLQTDKRAANAAHEARLREHRDPFCECTACGHLRMRGMACDNCGWQPKPKAQAIAYIDQDLIELGQTQRSELDRITFYRELRGHHQTARKKDGSPYHPKWPACQFKDKFGSWPPFAWNNQAPIAPTDATLRWIKSRQIAWARRPTT